MDQNLFLSSLIVKNCSKVVVSYFCFAELEDAFLISFYFKSINCDSATCIKRLFFNVTAFRS